MSGVEGAPKRTQHPSKKKGKLHSHVRHYFLSALNTFARRLSLSLSLWLFELANARARTALVVVSSY